MSAQSESIVVENITYYEEAGVVVMTPQSGSRLVFRGKPASTQFEALEKTLKAGEGIEEPVQIGDAACMLAPSLTIDTIRGPVFWEEIQEILNRKA